MAPFVAPAIAGVSAGAIAANFLPTDNNYARMAGGVAVGIITTRLCLSLVTLACPQLGVPLSVGAAVSSLVSFDHRNELIATVRCIGQVDECIANHRQTILAIKRYVDNAVTKGEKADRRSRSRREGDESDLDQTRRLLSPLVKVLRKLKQVFNN